MSKKNRERKAREAKRYAYRKNPFFTPRLNAGLERIMRDKSRDPVVQVWAWTARHSWGNWSPYAIEDRPYLPAAEDFDPDAQVGGGTRLDPNAIGALGPAPCPLCHKLRPPGETPADDWPWHLRCMAIAYAMDALGCGVYRQEFEWARSIAQNPENMARLLSEMRPAGGVQ